MNLWGTESHWPPESIDELAQLFPAIKWRPPPESGEEPDLYEACIELDGWLGDAREYERPRKDEWASLAEDFRLALHSRGPRVRRRDSDLDGVAAALHGRIGMDPAARGDLRAQLQRARSTLADPQAGVDAFNDLWESICDPACSEGLVIQRLSVLRAMLGFADRSLSTVTSQLHGIARDGARDVAFARQQLDAVDVPDDLLRPAGGALRTNAGLSTEERIDLMGRVLAHKPAANHHVVWVFYGHARFEHWIFKLGPVTFIDGPVLLSVFDQFQGFSPAGVGRAQDMWWFRDMPPELVEGEEAPFMRATHSWPELEHWVAARVDLGPGPHLDPLGEARRQADALVGLATFHGSGSSNSWVALTGHMDVIDGVHRGGSWPIREPDSRVDEWMLRDTTDSWLVENRGELEVHWPVRDDSLAELVECIAVLNEATRTLTRENDEDLRADGTSSVVSGPVVFLQRVRVLELLTTRLGVRRLTWTGFMERYLMDAWVREQVLERVFRAAERATGASDLRGHDDTLDHLRNELMTHAEALMVTTHRDVALAALPDLSRRLPAHHRDARRVREVAGRIADLQALQLWVNQLREEYRNKSARALRCRNSLTHGGPFNAAAMASINGFIRWQAGVATVTALRGVLAGASVAAALEEKRSQLTIWSTRLATATDVFDALVPDANPRTSST